MENKTLYTDADYSTVNNNGNGWIDERTQRAAIIQENKMRHEDSKIIAYRRKKWRVHFRDLNEQLFEWLIHQPNIPGELNTIREKQAV